MEVPPDHQTVPASLYDTPGTMSCQSSALVHPAVWPYCYSTDLAPSFWSRDGINLYCSPRRKIIPNDTTGALKLWLEQHKRNPYPSRAEKIMLAILSKMTLTQVSTWFANARRRLKKEFRSDYVINVGEMAARETIDHMEPESGINTKT